MCWQSQGTFAINERATPDMITVYFNEEKNHFLEYTFLKFATGEKISKSEPKKIIGSAEIEVHSVADDGLNKMQDFIKKYRLSDISVFSKYAVTYCNI